MQKEKIFKIVENQDFKSIYLNDIRFDGVDYILAQKTIDSYIDAYHKGLKSSGYVITPHSEFVYKAFSDKDFQKIINNSFLSTPDGISIIWLENFFMKKRSSSKTVIYFQAVSSLFSVFFLHGKKNVVIKSRVTGVDLLNYIFSSAQEKSYSIYLLGGFGDTGYKAAKNIKKDYPNVNITGFYEGTPNKRDEYAIIEKVFSTKTDILIVAYKSIVEEQWISNNLDKLNVGIAIGVGRSLDYIAGNRIKAPEFIRRMGLEWVFKIFADPKRISRQMVFFKLIKKSVDVKYAFYKK